jgi:hypothetical protein
LLSTGNYIGGLVGLSSFPYSSSPERPNIIRYCYATGNVTATNYADNNVLGFAVGGLVGMANHTDISGCFATGNVKALKGPDGGTMPVIAGGLVGYLGYIPYRIRYLRSSIADSYASGNVTADNPNPADARVYAGGLAGYVEIENPRAVNSSFATGLVSAHNASAGAGVWAGGFVGFAVDGYSRITNNAALGASVTVTGGGTRYIGRIFGNVSTTNKSNNHAFEDMRLFSDTYKKENPARVSPLAPAPAHDNLHGQDVTNTIRRTVGFWRNNPPLNNEPFNNNNGLGFESEFWAFNYAIDRGHPLLRAPYLLGGQ